MFKNLINTYSKLYKDYNKICLINKRFAGHSKWQNIRHVKGAKDAEKSLIFAKLGRMMRVAIQEGNSIDPNKNSKLQQVIDQCKRVNMPVATVQSILKSSQTDKTQCKMHMLEIKGPGSCIILCEIFTSNLHMTKQTIATLLRKHGSKFLDNGGRHVFEEKGIVETEILEQFKSGNAETILETATDHAIESGAEDVKIVDEQFLQFYCDGHSISKVQDGLEKLNYKIESASVEFIPVKVQTLNENELRLTNGLLEKLDALQEVVRLADNVALN